MMLVPTLIKLDKKKTFKIINYLKKKGSRGAIINEIMKDCKLARGTAKIYLTHLVYTNNVKEIVYAQNIKVYEITM